MQVELPYGDETLTADLPERVVALPTTSVGGLKEVDDLEVAVREALANPRGLPPLDEIAPAGGTVTIAFDDPTVMSFTPVRRLALDEMFRQLEAAGVPRSNIRLICANALHRKYRSDELAKLIGEDLVEEFGERLFCHDAEDAENLVYLGKTPGGYDVEISRYVMESDLTIYLNAAHNRGFSGGWKSVCVGLSTYRSIRHHHTPDGMSMSLHKNRMHAMLDEMGTLLEAELGRPIFKFDTVLANPFSVAGVFAGSVWETRKASIELLSSHIKDRRNLASEPFDAFLYGVPNWSPYAIFASMNPLLTLVSSGLGYLGGTVQALGKPGASVIMVTPCPDAWDEVHHASYPDVWANVLSKTRDPYEIQRSYAEKYATDAAGIEKYRRAWAFHPVHAIMACYPLRRLEHIGQVVVVGAEDRAVPEHLGFEAVDTIEEAIERVEARQGSDCRIGYLEQPATPPRIFS